MGVNNQGTYYQYDGNSVIADINQAGSVTTHYSRLPSGRLLSVYKYESVPEERDTYFVFSDVLGSTVMLFGKDSGKVEMYKYGEFGTYSTSGGTDPTRFTFTGMPYYNGPGLYQMGARYYNPAVGRFITRDTYRGNIYQPWTQNLYMYCNNNPVNYVDPTGHIPVETAADFLSIGWSAVDLWTDPSWANLGYLAWDLGATLVPYAPGSYVAKGAKAGSKVFNKADDVVEGAVNTYANFAKQATNNADSSEVILGKYSIEGRSYNNVAEGRGATYFQLDNWNEVSNKLGSENMWKINEQFLNQQWEAGKDFYLSHNPWEATGFFQQEVLHLIDLGAKDFIKTEDNLWKVVK